MRIATLFIVGASLVAQSLSAQGPGCAASETLAACRERLDSIFAVEAGAAFQAERGADSLAAALSGKTVGITSLGSGLSSTIGDFLPTLAGALGLTQTTTENGGTSFETNLRLPLGASLQRVRLQALLRKPELYQPLEDSLPAGSRDSRSAALQKELNDFDDIQVNVAWNLENAAFGRNFDIARPLVTTILRQQISEVETSGSDVANQVYVDLLQHSDAGLDPDRAGVAGCKWSVNAVERSVPLDCFTAGERAKLTSALIQSLLATRANEARIHELMSEAGLFQLPDLVNNQPQLSVQAGLDLRSDLVGPNDFSVTARYEGGFTNFNGLRRFGKNKCGVNVDSAISAACLQRYLADPGVASGLRNGDRFFITAAYSRRQDYAVRLPSDSVNLSLPGTWDFIASAGLGRYITFSRAGEQLGRLDLSADYVFHHDDPLRQNRLVAAGTYTFRISPSLMIAAGVSYSNKAEFLGDVNKQFGANFGLRYRFIKS
ncbi:MAG: hypothetical protein ABJD11_16110 [Gemmatimonadota bacterium]